jgi:threonine dehydratase
LKNDSGAGTRFPTLADVRAARERISAHVHVTPVTRSSLLDREAGCALHFKCENLQKTGSFKSRGALNAVSRLSDAQKRAGVVTVSAGNHAQALAWAAAAEGIACTVVMPSTATRSKIEASEGYGAKVVLESGSVAAFARARQIADEEHSTLVHPFDDPDIIAGAGTSALELHEQLRGFSAVIVPVGGGGLISGIAVAMRELAPTVRIYGVEPTGAAALHQSMAAGHPVRLEQPPRTIADGLAAPMAGELTYPIARAMVDDVVLVDDDAIAEAMRLVITRTKMLVEPAGAAGVAAILGGLIPGIRGTSVAVILSGGNVDLGKLG